jgi:type II secretory pathway pseudopilin PulG
MRTTVRSDHPRKFRRSAFTLVEIMVVITIMVALVALTAGAVLKYVGVQQTSNTQSTLDRVQSQLIKAWSKVKDQAKKEPIPPGFVAAYAGSDANAAERAKVIYLKLKMRAAFPMNFGEALNVAYNNPLLGATVPQSPVPSPPAYTTYLTSHGVNPAAVSASSPSDPRESAVCLLMALQRGVSGAGIDPSVLTAGGAAGDYNGMPYLTDAWGRPIFFSRAPTGSLYLNLAGPLAGANDPGDPQGLLLNPTWRTQFGAVYSALTLELPALNTLPINTSYKLAPMVASGGPSDWTKPGATLTFDPITFAPFVGGDALFSTP